MAELGRWWWSRLYALCHMSHP